MPFQTRSADPSDGEWIGLWRTAILFYFLRNVQNLILRKGRFPWKPGCCTTGNPWGQASQDWCTAAWQEQSSPVLEQFSSSLILVPMGSVTGDARRCWKGNRHDLQDASVSSKQCTALAYNLSPDSSQGAILCLSHFVPEATPVCRGRACTLRCWVQTPVIYSRTREPLLSSFCFLQGVWESSRDTHFLWLQNDEDGGKRLFDGKTEGHQKELGKETFKEEQSEDALSCFQSGETSSSRRLYLFRLSERGELEKHSARVASEDSLLRATTARSRQGLCQESFILLFWKVSNCWRPCACFILITKKLIPWFL